MEALLHCRDQALHRGSQAFQHGRQALQHGAQTLLTPFRGLLDPIDYADRLWSTLEERYPFLLREINTDITEKRKQLKNKEVIISVFGRHNCGKSTLLNAMLRNKLLPTDMENETCIEIKIRHDSEVHPGPCKDSCDGSTCPRLKQGDDIVRGAKNIEKKLTSEHDHFRKVRSVHEDGRDHYVVFANVPILEGPPDGWTITLVDTPGFGEANFEDIMKHADMLFNTTAGYLYLMDCNSLEDEVDCKHIKRLYHNDKGGFNKAMLTICANKMDQYLIQQSEKCIRRRETPPPFSDGTEKIERLIRSIIARSISSESSDVTPDVEVVPVCAHWADYAVWLREDPTNKYVKMQIKHVFEYHGKTYEEEETEKCYQTLEEMSGILKLSLSIKKMTKDCILIWKTSLTNAYTEYLEKASESLKKYRKNQVAEKRKAEDEQEKVNRYNDSMNGLHNLCSKIPKRVKSAYENKDLKLAMNFLFPKADIEEFIEDLKNSVRKRSVSPERFRQKVDEFNEKTAKELSEEQRHIELDGVLMELVSASKDMKSKQEDIEQRARDILPIEFEDPDCLIRERENEEEDLERSRLLTVGDMQMMEMGNTPQVEVGFWTSVLNALRKYFGGEEYYDKWTTEMESLTTSIIKHIKTGVDHHVTVTLRQHIVEVTSKKFEMIATRKYDALEMAFGNQISEIEKKNAKVIENCEKEIKQLDTDLRRLQDALSQLKDLSKTLH